MALSRCMLMAGMMALLAMPAFSEPEPASRPAATRPATRASMPPGHPKTTARSRTARRQAEPSRPPVLEPISPEAHKRAMLATREFSRKISRACKLDFAEIETDHFLIYHNWDRREERFLSGNLEDCYRVVAAQFDVAPSETVFAGKPAVFMIAGESEYADALGEIAPELDPKSYVGIARHGHDGQACIIMKKPSKSDYEDKTRTEKRWASTLAHEMTCLFAARYRTNRELPAWLSVGLAEVIETRLFPELYPAEYMSRRITDYEDIDRLIGLKTPRGDADYPAMQTMVETLLAADRGRFIDLVCRVKDGHTSDEALDQAYGWSLDDFQKNWMAYLKQRYKIRLSRQ